MKNGAMGWIATALLTILLSLVGVLYAKDSGQIKENKEGIKILKKQMDSIFTKMEVQEVRDSFFQAGVMQALGSLQKAAGVKVDSTDSL